MKINVVEESITTALLELMQKEEYKKITITDIVRKAGVSRVSYYRHFTTKEDVLIKYFDFVSKKFSDSVFDKITVKDWDYIITEIFIVFRENKLFIKSLKTAKLENLFLDYLTAQFESNYPATKSNKYFMDFLAGACYNTTMCWLANDCKDPIETVAKPFYEIQKLFDSI